MNDAPVWRLSIRPSVTSIEPTSKIKRPRITEIGVKLFNIARDIGYITHYIGHNFQDENVKLKGHQVSLHDAALERQETAVVR